MNPYTIPTTQIMFFKPKETMVSGGPIPFWVTEDGAGILFFGLRAWNIE